MVLGVIVTAGFLHKEKMLFAQIQKSLRHVRGEPASMLFENVQVLNQVFSGNKQYPAIVDFVRVVTQ